jgi:hypothetical protein
VSAIYSALVKVMKDVGAVKKGERNKSQGYVFRGVDAVVNAVYPAFVEHGISVQPNVRSFEYGTVEVGKDRTVMGHARVIVEYTFTSAEDGSAVTASAAGEAFDSGDKATPKAMSVALRTALLQSLMLPTDDPEPDASSYERAEPVDPIVMARGTVAAAWTANRGELDKDAVEKDYSDWSQGELFSNATADRLYQYAEHLKQEAGA